MEYSLGIALGVLGVCVVVWAVVRPRRGNEKHCRRCGFSLAGLTAPERCPEYGRGLAARRAVAVGHRPSPKRAVVWGAVLVGVAAVLVGLDAMNRSGFFPLTRYKPSALLQVEAYVLGDLRASMATDEIVARVGDGTLGPEAETRLVATALVRHAQTWRVFPDAQWMVITRAMGRNELSFEQIERVWEECFVEGRLLSTGFDDGVFVPGERVEMVAGVNVRAGTLQTMGIGSVGFALDASMRIKATDEAGNEELLAETRIRGPIVQRYVNQINPVLKRETDERIQLYFNLPERAGSYRGVVEYELAFGADMVASVWPGIDSTKLERLGTLRKKYEFPIEFEIVAPASIELPVVDPGSLAEDPASLVHFEVVSVYSAEVAKGHPGVMFRTGTTEALDPEIGLGGFIVFEQGGKEVRAKNVYTKPHTMSQQYMPLEGFTHGEVRVRYLYDRDRALESRGAMKRVLGGVVELGAFEIPETGTVGKE